MPADKPKIVPDLEPQATATVETLVPFEFRGETYHTRARPSVKTIRALGRQDFDLALESLIGPEEAATFYRRHDNDDGVETYKEFFDALAEHLGGNF
jgi:hypothetical protein